MSDQSEYTWARAFIAVALRAIRRVHFNYGAWGIGHHWLHGVADFDKLNTGHGIELADERSVCAAISQEFLSTAMTSGIYLEEDKSKNREEGYRYWRINQEVPYPGSSERADFELARYRDVKPKEPSLWSEKKVVIEAKRVTYYTPDIPNGSVKRSGTYQKSGIALDIEKLQRLMAKDGSFGHLLLWNDCTEEVDCPETICSELGLSLPHQVRWLPLVWSAPLKKPPEVTKWLWVALIEVGAANLN